MTSLTGAQRKHLRGLAHDSRPQVQIGQQGIADTVVASLDDALLAHELVKVKFVDHKDEKKALAAELAQRSSSTVVGIIGHVAIFFRQHPDPDKRRVRIDRGHEG